MPAFLVSLPGTHGAIFEVSSIRPGQTARGDVVVRNDSGVGFTYTFSVEATVPSILTTDTTNGLQLVIVRCDITYALCPDIVYTGPAIVTNAPLGGPDGVGTGGAQDGLAASGLDFLQLRFQLPADAGNAFRGISSTLRFIWTGTEAL